MDCTDCTDCTDAISCRLNHGRRRNSGGRRATDLPGTASERALDLERMLTPRAATSLRAQNHAALIDYGAHAVARRASESV